MDCRRRLAVDDDRSRRIRLAVDDDRRRGRWAVDDDRSRIAFYQAQVNESLDRIDKNLRSIRRMRMPSATIPASSSWLLSSASRDRKLFQNQPVVVDAYPSLELPLRWRDPPPEYTPLDLPFRWQDSPPLQRQICDSEQQQRPTPHLARLQTSNSVCRHSRAGHPTDRAHYFPLPHLQHSTHDSMTGIEFDSTLEIAEQSRSIGSSEPPSSSTAAADDYSNHHSYGDPKTCTRLSSPDLPAPTPAGREQSVLGPILYFVAEHKSVEMEMEKKSKAKPEEIVQDCRNTDDSKKQVGKERNLDLQLDLEKQDKDFFGVRGKAGSSASKHYAQKQQPRRARVEPRTEKSVESLPLPMQIPGWPDGLPSFGYMAQLPLPPFGPVDASTSSSKAVQILFPSQLQAKSCATHCYIAQNIHQMTRLHPYWPSAIGAAPFYVSKQHNLSTASLSDSTILSNLMQQGSLPGKSPGSMQEKEGVQMLDVKATDKADPTPCSQAARGNVADDFRQLGVDLTFQDKQYRQLILLKFMSSKGVCCLDFAYQDYYTDSHPAHKKQLNPNNYYEIESNLIFVGVIGLRDPPRAEAYKAIEYCRGTRIKVIIIIGDNNSTTELICHEIGLARNLQGVKWRGFTDKKKFSLLINQKLELLSKPIDLVFPCAKPRHKLEIVRLLQEPGEVVATTEDGVNDAPTLKLANIGISLSITESEIAKEAGKAMRFLKKSLKQYIGIDLVGQLVDVEFLIKFMTVEANGVIWKLLLSACRIFDPGGLII